MKTYYIYCWTNTKTGEQYVGRGCGRRAFQHVLDSMQPHGGGRLAAAMRGDMYRWFRLEFLAADLDEKGAQSGEREEIRRLQPAYNTYMLKPAVRCSWGDSDQEARYLEKNGYE